MANLNKVMLIGNIVADIEIRYTPKGTAVTDLRMAVNRNWTNDQGQRQEDTTFVDVTFWGRQAEVAGKYLSKGRSVFIEGRLHMDTWDDKNTGQKRSRLKIVGERLEFLGGGGGGGAGGGGGGGQQPQQHADNGGEGAPAQDAPAQDAPAQDAPEQPQAGGSPAEPADYQGGGGGGDNGDDEIPF